MTNLTADKYDNTWRQFGSEFWEYKKTIFGVKQKRYCYAGDWSCYINLATGMASGCYCGPGLGNVFNNPDEPFPEKSIGHCPVAHCYNGHAFMTFGLIPGSTNVGYGDIRDRLCNDGSHWLQPELKAFFNTKLIDSNKKISFFKALRFFTETLIQKVKHFAKKLTIVNK